MVLGADVFFAFRFNEGVGLSFVEETGFAIIFDLEVDDIFEFEFDRGVIDGESDFEAVVEVSFHPVGGGDVDFF